MVDFSFFLKRISIGLNSGFGIEAAILFGGGNDGREDLRNIFFNDFFF